tara:strand:+ start:538 stop:726 length:189 start_codon:yes stop_codon:yes gene_type:complete
MLDNIIYVLATLCLVIGSSLTFDKNQIADYFYLLGSTLFLIKASLSLVRDLRKNKPDYTSLL